VFDNFNGIAIQRITPILYIMIIDKLITVLYYIIYKYIFTFVISQVIVQAVQGILLRQV